ncbi:MAG: SUMF1/EgtB/PvdO family nonheme iron enzyme [Proteobacteria bacterium]|nr:SUMF1/EgtB/PvdO family nonheme iron enzyme [Pseudomonadota bacterium]
MMCPNNQRVSMFVKLLLLAIGLTVVCPEIAIAQTQVKPRILMIFDTSGSMIYDISGAQTWGDGSWDPWTGGRFCCPGLGGSRLYIAKEAMRQMIFATGDIDFALMKFPQDYISDQDDTNSCTYVDDFYEDNQGTGDDDLRYTGRDYTGANCGGSSSIYNTFNYGGGSDNTDDWLCVPFYDGNAPEILSWMDHHEYSFTDIGEADDSIFAGPHGDYKEQELRGDGNTPLGASVRGAYYYLLDMLDDDTLNECRPYSVIVLTDGDPVTDPYDAETWVGNLYSIGTREAALSNSIQVDTWVVGLAHNSTTLDDMAAAGGEHYDPNNPDPNQAFMADSQDSLSSILSTIISESLLIEVCNDVDDDCDGVTDEGFVKCDHDGNGSQDCPPHLDETCDGVDNNCDGETDEGTDDGSLCDPPGGPYDYGDYSVCKQGVMQCNSATGEQECVDAVGPDDDEVCNGLDDDCNGLVDDGVDYTTETGEEDRCPDYSWVGVGACLARNYECDSDLGMWLCADGVEPTDETPDVCNNIDEDCDGETDEGIIEDDECKDPGAISTDPPSICTTGIKFCGEAECRGAIGPKTEKCNGLDDNCDGATDNGLTPEKCTYSRTGEPTEICNEVDKECVDGAWECNADPPQQETCNNVDDDCNGYTDDNAEPPAPIGGLDLGQCSHNGVFPDRGECEHGTYICDSANQEWDCVGGLEPVDESCNGKDDDCNGLTDDGLTGLACGLGPADHETDGECEEGTWMCVSDGADGKALQCCTGVDTNNECVEPQGPTSEDCNGKDDDCDGVVDEFLTESCRTGGETYVNGQGICHEGTWVCGPQIEGDFGWGSGDPWVEDVCGNEQLPEDEECDCLDNDCDGLTDETLIQDSNGDYIDYVDETLGAVDNVCGYGDCGVYVCDPDKCDYVCSGYGEPETCNGLDDNCNTLTDEGLFERCGGCDSELYPPANHPVEDCMEALDAGTISGPDEGECQRGVSWCDAPDAGVEGWADCEGSIGPKDELCDNKDNDCDGVTDENEDIDKVGDQCRTAEGICEDGWWRCVDDGNDGKSLECCASVTPTNECVSPQEPEIEECNCLDDDCDGETDEDEDLPIVGESCGWDVGICEAGEYQCSQDICDIECVGEKPGTEEECNCLDDDCDGLTDDDLPLGATCTNSPSGEPEGLCDEGNMECIDCGWECNANEPSVEKCNGLDDDCDGLTDENLSVDCPEGSTCIQGECSEPCAGEEMACPEGKTCEWVEDENNIRLKVCVSDVCNPSSEEALECVDNPFWCDQGHEPPCECDVAQGKCVGQCDNVSCPEGKVCVSKDGTCQAIGDDCWTNGCVEGQRCVGGECVADPCSDKNCADDKYCNADGDCVEPCEDMDCQAGCYEGECVDDICTGVWCPKGFECNEANGKCVNDEECAKVACRFYEVCKDGECIDDPCWNIECLNGQICIDGACYVYENTGPDGDTDTDTDGDTDGDSDGDSDGDTDGDSDTDTTVTISDGGTAPSDMNRVLATGMGGCLCTSTPGRQGQGSGVGIVALFGLMMVIGRFGVRRRKFSFITLSIVTLAVLLAGCDVEPYEFEMGNGDTGTSDGDSDSDSDTDGDTDTDSDGDSDSDTDSETCQSDEEDDDCDGVDDDCDSETDEDVNLNMNANHCGRCNNPCQYEHAMGICKDGKCEMDNCGAYWWDENKSDTDGCEYFCEPKGDQDLCNGVDLGDDLYKAVDDDCDGETDEDVDFETNAVNCGRCGNICRFAHAEVDCVDGKCTWDECEEEFWDVDTDTSNGCEYSCTKESDDETCDNLDENCDGNVDEGNPGGGGDCYTGDTGCTESGGSITCKGICEAGTLQCINGSLQCIGQKTPNVMEECNNLDDDCDGNTDENLFQICESLTGANVEKYNKGVCARGAQTCQAGVWGAESDGTWTAGVCGGEILPSEELCNGADDDCDDLTDGFDTDMAELGECSHVPGTLPSTTGNCLPGTYNCVDGDWACIGGIAPEAEDCNGEDDNCDSNTDENITQTCGGCDPETFPDAPTDCNPDTQQNEGLCQVGIRYCVGNDDWGDCLATIPPSEEVCDNKDNDCDGNTDEGVTKLVCGGGPTNFEEEGECTRGERTCSAGAFGACEGSVEPVAEDDESVLCDNKDNDCDGETDEDLYRKCNSEVYDEVGICHKGIEQCSSGTWGDCLGEVTPRSEECNGLNDDCDTETDEEADLTAPGNVCPSTCPDGTTEETCSGTAGWTCDYIGCGTEDDELECTDGKPNPVETRCDDFDNNCDGDTDEAWDFDIDEDNCGDCDLSCGDSSGSQWSDYGGTRPDNVDLDTIGCMDGKCKVYACEDNYVELDGECCGPVVAEKCDNPGDPVDNDCDGDTDENKLDYEICNGLDDDCNSGTLDGDLELDDMPQGTCKRKGACGDNTPTCEDSGGWGWNCNYSANVELDGSEVETVEAKCDGYDGNCDGLTDEGFDTLWGDPAVIGSKCDNSDDPNNIGACFQEGWVTCNNAKDGLVCCKTEGVANCGTGTDVVEQTPTPGTEEGTGQPDGVDDDCDGFTDDGVTGCVTSISVPYGASDSFEMFKYEASRIDADDEEAGLKSDSVPCSESDRDGVIDPVLPWTLVSFKDARAACLRLNDSDTSGCSLDPDTADANPTTCWDLCSTAQWYYACAYGDGVTDPNAYPYANTYDGDFCNGSDYDSGAKEMITTGAAQKSGTEQCIADWDTAGDVWDLSGNVEEWTLGAGGASGDLRVIRGGSYKTVENGLACNYDFWAADPEPNAEGDYFQMDQIGFRCCRLTEPMDSCEVAINHIKDHPFDFEGSASNDCSMDGWLVERDYSGGLVEGWETGIPSGSMRWDSNPCVLATGLADVTQGNDTFVTTSPIMDLNDCDIGGGHYVYVYFDLVQDIYNSGSCSSDWGDVQAYNGSSWVTFTNTSLKKWNGSSWINGYDDNNRWCSDIGDPPSINQTWTQYRVDVSTAADENDEFQIQFRVNEASCSSSDDYGMYIDNVKLGYE